MREIQFDIAAFFKDVPSLFPALGMQRAIEGVGMKYPAQLETRQLSYLAGYAHAVEVQATDHNIKHAAFIVALAATIASGMLLEWEARGNGKTLAAMFRPMAQEYRENITRARKAYDAQRKCQPGL